MIRLLGLVVSIGLADSLNPSTVGPALYLATGAHPRRAVLRFTGSLAAVFVLGGLVLTIGPGQLLLALIPHPDATVRYIAETVAGAAMLVVAAVLWLRREQLGHRRHEASGPKQHSPGLLGVIIGAVEFPTAFPYFAAIAAIVASGLSVPQEALLVAIYNLCFVLPLLGIVVVLTVAGDRAEHVLTTSREYLRAHWPVIVAALAFVAGLFTLALGITGLTSGTPGRLGRVSRRVRRVISP
ncbi:MAG TPA: GAP family protein [Solirubrobacteraceae bacterium]|nr:GAP family protein [Solirubrobacteraceae bacterium]